MTDDGFAAVQSEDDHNCRVRLERTASGKWVQMLTANEKATEEEMNATIDRVTGSFSHFNTRVDALREEVSE